jgi:hypothetical protein
MKLAMCALATMLMAQETPCNTVTIPQLPPDCVAPEHQSDPTCPSGTRLRHDEATDTLWCCPRQVD